MHWDQRSSVESTSQYGDFETNFVVLVQRLCEDLHMHGASQVQPEKLW